MSAINLLVDLIHRILRCFNWNLPARILVIFEAIYYLFRPLADIIPVKKPIIELRFQRFWGSSDFNRRIRCDAPAIAVLLVGHVTAIDDVSNGND